MCVAVYSSYGVAQMSKESEDVAAMYGAITAIIGYVITFIVKYSASRQYVATIPDSIPSAPTAWQVVGWIYLRMHTVETRATVTGSDQSPPTIPIDITASGSILWDSWLLIIPPLLLVIAGYALARDQDAIDVTQGPRKGATLVVGYLPIMALGAFFTQWDIPLGVRFGPDLSDAVLIAGIAYPTIAGAIGGLLYSLQTSIFTRDTAQRPHTSNIDASANDSKHTQQSQSPAHTQRPAGTSQPHHSKTPDQRRPPEESPHKQQRDDDSEV